MDGLEAAREILYVKKGARITFASADPSIREAAHSIGGRWVPQETFRP